MEHIIPQWFINSDFGVFIHYGLYSIPAFAVTNTSGEKKNKPFVYNKYSEWYANSIKIKDSPAQIYHNQTFGTNFLYQDFAPEFNNYVDNVDVDKWVEKLSDVDAKYVIFVAKHHDGFCMWNTKISNSKTHGNFCTKRDFVGDLAAAVRAKGIKFGIYYSSLLDWTFIEEPIIKRFDIRGMVDYSEEYKEYVYNQWLELIDRYKPDILWSDIGYPDDESRLCSLFEYYHSVVPNGLINDRWTCFPECLIGHKPIRQTLFQHSVLKKSNDKLCKYFDYRTTEYREMNTAPPFYWEMCRGIDLSFGYNKFSLPEHCLSGDEIIKLISRVYSRKGRLLLNIGPMGNGDIPKYQKEILDKIAESRGKLKS